MHEWAHDVDVSKTPTSEETIMVIHSMRHHHSTQPAQDVHAGRPVDRVYRERGERLTREWEQTDTRQTGMWTR